MKKARLLYRALILYTNILTILIYAQILAIRGYYHSAVVANGDGVVYVLAANSLSNIYTA